MVNNFERIRTLINFDEGGIYHLQILQRSKDGHDKSSRIVAEWFITSNSRFEFIRPAVISMCNEYQARAYINLNGKLESVVLWKIVENGLDMIKNNSLRPANLLASSVGQCYSPKKIWVIDIDDKDADLELLQARIEQCQSGYTRNVIDILPTVNGFHILTCPFNIQELNRDGLPEFDIHKNNPTLLYSS